MICPSMISTPALTASDGRTDGTTSPDPRPRRSTCSRASIWVTQDQRLGRPARSCWRCPRRQRMRARHYRRNPIVLANHDRTKPIAKASVEPRGEPSTPRSNLRSKAFPPRRTNLVASPRLACSEPVPSGSDRSNPSLSAVESEARGFSRGSFWNLVFVGACDPGELVIGRSLHGKSGRVLNARNSQLSQSFSARLGRARKRMRRRASYSRRLTSIVRKRAVTRPLLRRAPMILIRMTATRMVIPSLPTRPIAASDGRVAGRAQSGSRGSDAARRVRLIEVARLAH